MVKRAVWRKSRTSCHAGPRLAVWIGLVAAVSGAGPAAAFSFSETILRCRETVGVPIVRACVAEGGRDFDACRARASPQVRACVRKAMVAAYGWTSVRGAIEQCRQSTGRPIVRACMGEGHAGLGREGGPRLAACRLKAFPQVRACVRRTLSAG